MMALIKLIFALAFVVQVSANPGNLQQLYGAPSHPGNHSNDFSNDHVGSGNTLFGDTAHERQNLILAGIDGTLSHHGDHSNDFSNDHVESGNTLFSDAAHERLGSNLAKINGIRQNAAIERKATVSLDSTLLINDAINQNQNIEAGTVTMEVTVDVFKTLTNVIYNSIPVTLTQFLKTTLGHPTVQVLTTNVDDRIFVATAPVTRTNTITVTDTSTNFQCATDVSTDFYTVTHRAYDIRQQVVTSTILQTKVFRPTVVSTLIKTEFETETNKATVTNTVYIEPRLLKTIVPNAGIGVQFGDRSFGQTLPQDQQFSESGFAPDVGFRRNVHRGSHYY